MKQSTPKTEKLIENFEDSMKKLELLRDCLLCGNWKDYGDKPVSCVFYRDGCPPECVRRRVSDGIIETDRGSRRESDSN